MSVTDDDIKNMLHETFVRLDDEDYDAYLELCAPVFRYRITTYSPDLRKDQVWLDHDREGMAELFGNIQYHVRLPGTFFRHGHVYRIDRNGNGVAKALTSMVVHYTEPVGDSRVFALCRYHDDIDLSSGTPLLASREVRLETRQLGTGSHIPM